MNEVIRHADVMKPGGGALINEHKDGSQTLKKDVFESIGQEVSDPESNIVLVTSIAIAMGMIETGTTVRPDPKTQMPELQRFATIGWRPVLNLWDEAIEGKATGSLLLTKQELGNTARRQEALRVIHTLLRHGDAAVANENDAITHDEITFGSNDILSGILAARMQKSNLFGEVRLFLLTDVNGVYEDVEDSNTRIPVIESTDDYRHLALGSGSDNRIGGMSSKFEAVDIAKGSGVDTWIYDPSDGPRMRAVAGEIGTYFPA